MSNSYDVIVIGAGPAGYVAAIRCAQLGLNTACVDNWINKKNKPALGGTCLNVGCIPSKALLESSEIYQGMRDHAKEHGISARDVQIDIATMIQRKDKIVTELTTGIESLFKSNKVEWIAGHGQLYPDRTVLITPHSGKEKKITAKNIILATGSTPVEISAAPLQDHYIVDSSGALEWTEVPKRLGVIGAGVIGLELGSVWQRLGAKVTILEAQDIFLSMADQQIAKEAYKQFSQQNLDIRLGTLVKSTQVSEKGIKLNYQDQQQNQSTITVDRLIVAVGRRPLTDGLAATETELLLDERGFIHVNNHCRTNLPGVYAIGDVVRGPMLAHKGSEEGVMVAEIIAGKAGHINYDAIPWVIYTHPEIAWVGKTEQALKTEGIPYKSGNFPFTANGRAKAMDDAAGMVKILAHAETDRLLGVHIVGPMASELIQEAVLAMEFAASSEDLARTIHGHPTLYEAVHEAALSVHKRALHMINK